MKTSNKANASQSGTQNWHEFAKHRGRVLHREQVARNVHLYTVEKPDGFSFRPGQAVELAIDEEGWRDEKRPFTMTSVPSDPRLEFIVKSYPTKENPNHDGMTEHLGRDIEVNDRVIFGDPWGTIEYQGPGIFIAGGAGITPFISILRMLHQQHSIDDNRLFYSNKTSADVILQGELFRMLGRGVVCTLTQENHRDYEHGRIDRQWLEKRVDNLSQPFYLCGPPAMVEELRETLDKLDADANSIVLEGKS